MAPQMTPQVLADYIKSQLQRGITESQIKDYLLTEKIAQADIDEALKIVKGPSINQLQPAPLQQAAPIQPSSQSGAFQQPSMAKPAMPQQPIASKPNIPQQPRFKPNMPQQPLGSSISQPQILNTMAAGKSLGQQVPSMNMGNTPGAINIPDSGNIIPKKTSKMFYAILAIVLVLIIGVGVFAYLKFISVSAPVVEIPSQQTAAPVPVAPVSQGVSTTTQIAASSTIATSSIISTSTQTKATSTKITSIKATSTTPSVSAPKSAATSTLP